MFLAVLGENYKEQNLDSQMQLHNLWLSSALSNEKNCISVLVPSFNLSDFTRLSTCCLKERHSLRHNPAFSTSLCWVKWDCKLLNTDVGREVLFDRWFENQPTACSDNLVLVVMGHGSQYQRLLIRSIKKSCTTLLLIQSYLDIIYYLYCSCNCTVLFSEAGWILRYIRSLNVGLSYIYHVCAIHCMALFRDLVTRVCKCVLGRYKWP